MNIEENIKRIAREKGCRLGEIQERIGISKQSYYSALKNPRLSTIQRFADALNVQPWQLLKDDATEQQQPEQQTDINQVAKALGFHTTAPDKERSAAARSICPHCGKPIRVTITTDDQQPTTTE